MMRFALILSSLLLLTPAGQPQAQPVLPDTTTFAGFVEPDFPFITTTINADDLAPALPERNVAVRAVVVQLGEDSYAAFDPDLLRMAVAWRGDFLSLTTMAAVSYHEFGNKENAIPRVLGEPIFGTGVYPGWTRGAPDFTDPRPPAPDPNEVGRGPFAPEHGRWNGLYVAGDKVVFSYTVGEANVYEQPSVIRAGKQIGIARTFHIDPAGEHLSLVLAEDGALPAYDERDDRVRLYHGRRQDEVTVFGLSGAPAGAGIEIVRGRYVVLHLPPAAEPSTFSVVAWRGPVEHQDTFEEMRSAPVEMADFQAGSKGRWQESVTRGAAIAPDSAALVVDTIERPLPNPWRRNVRVSDVDFFENGDAAVATFEGDVWLVSGFDDDLQQLVWRRFASGLYESMSISIVDGQVYVFGREGIVRLRDLNGDGEADFYENFSNLAIQSAESREFPLSMVEKPSGGFYLAKGAALDMGPRTAAATMPGFRAGGWHSGTVLEVSSDGRRIEMVAGGLREPYLGVHPRTGLLTASDQQGNFVPATPIYIIRKGGFYGVPATAHQHPIPEPTPPLTWVPHEVDPSGAEQVWITGGRMGPLDGSLVHLSYGRPTAYRILTDSLGSTPQGGILTLPVRFPGPVMKGEMHPIDGRLYVTGFQVWGSQAEGVSGFYRLRPTGMPLILPEEVQAGSEGIILRFTDPLDPAVAADPERYEVRRWNYQRTERYGSGHFRLDGESGQETQRVMQAQISRDRRAIFLALPDMQEVMQTAVRYRLRSEGGSRAEDAVYLTVNEVAPLDLEAAGFDASALVSDELAARPAGEPMGAGAEVEEPAGIEPTAELGRHLFLELGCVACHSTDGSLAGKVGPSLLGLFGSTRRFADGTTAQADESYIRESILQPSEKIVEGFDEGMPVYEGVLDDAHVDALILFIRSLSDDAPVGAR